MKEKRLSWSIKDNGYDDLSTKKKYTYKFKSSDILLTDNDYRDELIENLVFEFKLALQSTLFGGCWGHGSSKDMKKTMKPYVKKKLENLNEDEFEFLRKTGMLWEFYPEAPDFWKNSQ